MNTIIGSKTAYLLVQRNADTGEEMALNYNSYNGMFNSNPEIEYATRWDSVETVDKLAATQNLIAQLLGQKYSYVVIKESVTREENVAA